MTKLECVLTQAHHKAASKFIFDVLHTLPRNTTVKTVKIINRAETVTFVFTLSNKTAIESPRFGLLMPADVKVYYMDPYELLSELSNSRS
jgi:hypothetical protein